MVIFIYFEKGYFQMFYNYYFYCYFGNQRRDILDFVKSFYIIISQHLMKLLILLINTILP